MIVAIVSLEFVCLMFRTRSEELTGYLQNNSIFHCQGKIDDGPTEKNHFDAIDQLLKCLEGKLKKKLMQIESSEL